MLKTNNIKCILGVVYATWCPHCQTLVGHDETEYENSDWYRIKQMLEQNINDKGTTYSVNKTESEETAEIDNLKQKGIVVNGYPTIYKYYISGDDRDAKHTGLEYFNGSRDINSILEWTLNHANRFGKGFKMLGGRLQRTRLQRTRLQRTNKRKNRKTRKGKSKSRRNLKQ